MKNATFSTMIVLFAVALMAAMLAPRADAQQMQPQTQPPAICPLCGPTCPCPTCPCQPATPGAVVSPRPVIVGQLVIGTPIMPIAPRPAYYSIIVAAPAARAPTAILIGPRIRR